MKGTMSNLILFAVGAAIGSAVTWKLLKEKYEKIADEEIASMKEFYSRKEVKETVREEKTPDTEEEIYKQVVKNYSEVSTERQNEKKEEKNMSKPYIIAPEEFGENEEYECVSLTYYSDNVLTDECDEPMDYVDASVGSDFMKHFGEYEDDSVFIRNDETKCYYEILRDQTRYRDRFQSGE